VNVANDKRGKLLVLTLAALGVVYGDIGTSPLYAVNEIFFGRGRLPVNPTNVLGAISLILWAVIIIISVKYIIFVLRADNEGEGGVFALSALLEKIRDVKKVKFAGLVSVLLVLAAGLLFGDGVITPAISVLSAVEGLSGITSAFSPYIVPITLVILTGLFLLQSQGTDKVGKLFGPIIVCWFLVIGWLGLRQIVIHPQILMAINPAYALSFLLDHHLMAVMMVLGSVMLSVTGGEAMYADMGHFGRDPIRLGWFGVVFPALMLNYLGQGAFLLSGSAVGGGNLFYALVPKMFLMPMVILATMATIIASQALISGAFSLAVQAGELGLLPRMKVRHTHHEHEGQLYVAYINWSLYVGCILLVCWFNSSTRLASAYGLAVSGCEVVTTIAMFLIARYYWQWSKWLVALIFVPLFVIDSTMLSANLLKLADGGFVPLAIGIFLMVLMKIWNWGIFSTREALEKYPTMTLGNLIEMRKAMKSVIPKTVIFLTSYSVTKNEDKVPVLVQDYCENHEMLPKHMVFLYGSIKHEPYVKDRKYRIIKLFDQGEEGSILEIEVNFGFMDDPNIEEIMEEIAEHRETDVNSDPAKWSVYLTDKRLVERDNAGFFARVRFVLFELMQRNSDPMDHFFGINESKVRVNECVVPVILN
jgi:KUP system potassium uptake protein